MWRTPRRAVGRQTNPVACPAWVLPFGCGCAVHKVICLFSLELCKLLVVVCCQAKRKELLNGCAEARPLMIVHKHGTSVRPSSDLVQIQEEKTALRIEPYHGRKVEA